MKRFTRFTGALPLMALLAFAQLLRAEPTQIDVRVLAKDAKFIGSSMEGAAITVTDLTTQQIIASGKTQGATGDTTLIMKTPRTRNGQLSNETSAVFSATLDIEQPTRVRITARGPLNLEDGAMQVSTDLWLIPGKHLNKGDGILLELPGFYIKSGLKQPPTADLPLVVTSEIRMMCGCPIEPNGLWNANDYEITAILQKNGEEIARKSMKFVETSVFEASFALTGPGDYQLITFAYDPYHANTGVDQISFKIPQ
jgi:hypothetical protein